MHPLIYLTLKQIKNGIIRALRSPRRLIGLVLITVFWLIGPLRSLFFGSSRVRTSVPPEVLTRFQEVNMAMLEAGLFLIFTAIVWMHYIGLLSRQATSSKADLDVLFPTPVPPKFVLGYKIAKETLTWLLVPLIWAIFGMRTALSVGGALAKAPLITHFGLALQSFFIVYLLLTATMLGLAYALGLVMNRPGAIAERRRKITFWVHGIVGVGFIAAVITLISLQGWEKGLITLHSPALRALFVPAEISTQAIGRILTGDLAFGFGFIGILALLVVGSFAVALRQAPWMYEVAAQRSALFGDMQELTKKGDVVALRSAAAQRGQFRKFNTKWLHRWSPQGIRAILWKDCVLHFRVGQFLILAAPILIFAIQFGITQFAQSANYNFGGTIGAACLGLFCAIMVMSSSQSGMMELIMRVEVLKSMPFSARSTAIAELGSKALINVILMLPAALAGIAMFPRSWDVIVAAYLLGSGCGFLGASSSSVVTFLLPDFEDVAQKGLRGLFSGISALALIAMPVGLFVVLYRVLKFHVLLAALPGLGVALILTSVLYLLAGRIFQDFELRN